jgi:hypothetical protein
MSPNELAAALGAVFRDVVAGRVAPSVGNCAANIARALVVVRDAGEIETRLAALEVAAGLGERRGA